MNSVRFRALLIEDDPLVTELARIAAAESCPGLDVIVLEGVGAALEWLNGSAEKIEQVPYIILLDLKLPKLDGLAMLRTIRHYPSMRNIPIVVFSTEYTQADVLMSYQAGANSFVAKPADQEQFGELFREQLAYWAEHRPLSMLAAAKGDFAGRI